MSKTDKKISPRTEQAAGEYLFDMEGMTESQSLDMRSRIESEDTMKALLFYGVLSEGLKCTSAGNIKDMVERMLIARKGTGRLEAVTILRQQFPRIREVAKGTEGIDEFESDAIRTVE